MSCEDMTRHSDDRRDQAASSSVHAPDIEVPGPASDRASPLAQLDAAAASALSSKALVRYKTYKDVLLAREPDEAAIVSTLTLFIWDLTESR